MSNIKLSNYDLYFLIIGSFRYALGRQTYIVHETINFLKKNWDHLDFSVKETIIRDLKTEVELHYRTMKIKNYSSLDDGWVITNLGGKYDIIDWLDFFEWVNKSEEIDKENV